LRHRKTEKRKQKSHHHHRGHNPKCDNHHIYPRSRKKNGDLCKFKPLLRSLRLKKTIKIHSAWHHLFINLFPEEALLLIKQAFENGKRSTGEIISFIKQNTPSNGTIIEATKEDINAWREVFDSYWSWKKIKKTIKRDWMYPGIKAIISKRKIIGVMIFLKNIPKINRIFDGLSRCKDIQIMALRENQLLKIT